MRRLAVLGVLAAAPAPAAADEAPTGSPTRAWLEHGGAVPAARAPETAAVAVRLEGGWDTGAGAAVGAVDGAFRVWRHLHALGGAQWSRGALRPTAGAAIAFDHWGVSLAYRPEGLTEPEGELELGVAATRRLGRARVVANAVYGQDPEARERDAEQALAISVRLTDRLWCSAGERLRVSLGAPMAGEPAWDLVAGPQLTVDTGPLAVSLFAGASARDTSRGALATLAIGRAF